MKRAILGLGAVAVVAVLGALAYMAYSAPKTANLIGEDENEELQYLFEMFENFAQNYNKYYFNDEEHHYRREIYIQSLIEVYRHNLSEEGKQWQKGINRFSDLTK